MGVISHLFASLRRAVRWHRRLLAAVFAGLAVYCVLAVVTVRDDTVTVLAVATALPGGQPLTTRDLTPLQLPAAAVPDGALTSADQAVGRALVARLPARAVLTADSLASGDSLVEPGRVALPVSLADSALLGLLRVGDRIDLLGTGQSGTVEVLASAVRVAALPKIDAGLLGGQASAVLVDVTREEAARLVSAGSPLSFALS